MAFKEIIVHKNISLSLSLCRTKTERRKSFIGNQLDDIKDLSGLYYLLPFQKGYLVNWDTQRQVWGHVFQTLLKITPSDLNLVITEPPFNFPSVREAMVEVLFEEYGFSSLCLTTPSSLSSYHQLVSYPDRPCCLVVDCGYSFTHIVPFYRGKALLESALRIDVGGKLLSNHLKEIVSYRQLNVMDETYVMNQVKEETCFVSQDLYGDMALAREKGEANTIALDYVLPDFTAVKTGYIRPKGKTEKTGVADEQILRLANERFSIPEILFNPSDVSIPQMGIPEAIVHSISATPTPMHQYMYANILLTGGSTRFPGFRERVLSDVRKLSPDVFPVNVDHPDRPELVPWLGGQKLAQGDGGEGSGEHLKFVTQAEYRESGHSLCNKRFHENQIILQSNYK